MSMTPKELIKEVYEIAFGEDAYLRGFFPEEVVERLQEFSDGSNPINIDSLGGGGVGSAVSIGNIQQGRPFELLLALRISERRTERFNAPIFEPTI